MVARRERGVNLSQALNVWIIQIVVAIGPPLGALIFTVYMKTDWGISLFFLTPLALVAIPALRVQKIALFNIAAIWLVITLAVLAPRPDRRYEWRQSERFRRRPTARARAGARTDRGLARALPHALGGGRRHHRDRRADDLLQSRSSGAVHARRVWSSGLTSLEEAKRLGFIGICDTTDWRLPSGCEAWMESRRGEIMSNSARSILSRRAALATPWPDRWFNAERLVITTQRFFHGHLAFGANKGTVGSLTQFNRRIAPPGTRFFYASIEPDVLGTVLRYATGQSLSDYLHDKVWEPVGAEADATWLIDAEGFEVAHHGFNAVLRDYARLGRLFANDGAWQGKQIIPAQWMIDATTVRASDAYLAPGKLGNGAFGYGYLLWLLPGTRRQFALFGDLGQRICVDPPSSLNLLATSSADRVDRGFGLGAGRGDVIVVPGRPRASSIP
jgi:hypothetical protein